MQSLNPTLWRTCRMLAGITRMKLFRELYTNPGLSVSALGHLAGIRQPAASQELRRIQSRGLLRAERRGRILCYYMAADPQVSSASSLLKAIQVAFSGLPPENDRLMCNIAAGLSHERRIQMVRALMPGPSLPVELQHTLHIPPRPFQLHLQKLLTSGFVVRTNEHLHWTVPNHPLAAALAKLLQQGVVR